MPQKPKKQPNISFDEAFLEACRQHNKLIDQHTKLIDQLKKIQAREIDKSRKQTAEKRINYAKYAYGKVIIPEPYRLWRTRILDFVLRHQQ